MTKPFYMPDTFASEAEYWDADAKRVNDGCRIAKELGAVEDGQEGEPEELNPDGSLKGTGKVPEKD